jgi:hypothetical protein
MIRNEEYRVRIQTPTGIPVEGVVRVRRFGGGRDGRTVAFERHEPVAVIVHKAGRDERIEFPGQRPFGRMLAFAAMPVAARLVTRMLTQRRRRIT